MGEGRHLDGSLSGATDPGSDEVETAAAGAPRSERVAPVGESISRYVVLEEVGVGGMGRVLRAYDPKLQREVALKEVRGDTLGVEGTKRLVAEARAMAKLSHPNVVAVYDVEELDSGELVLVMEFVAGRDLKEWLRENDWDWREVIDRFLAAGRGLAAAHGVGLLHRDFKPANVLLSDVGTVKVTDFGLAKAAGDHSSSRADSVHSGPSEEDLTEDGVVLGTPRYMAPEQHRGETLTTPADQYAFCIALWEALCGQPPFSGKGMTGKKRDGPPTWPKAGIPGSIAQAVRRGLSPNPVDRWPSMDALLEELAWAPSRRRNRWLFGLGGVGVLGLAGLSWESWATARADQCTGAQGQMAGIWDEARKGEVREAILSIGKSYAAQVWERTERELGRYAQEWTAMHTETCEATALRGEQSTAVMDLRMACLHRAAVELDAVTAELSGADASVVEHAHKLTSGLRPLARCADIEALQQQVEPPLPSQLEAVQRIRALLAASNVARQAGRYAQAKDKVDEAKAALADVEYGPLQAEVAYSEGYTLDRLGRYEASEAALRDALELASQWRQWELMRDAALKLIYVVGYRQQRMEGGLRYAELAQGLAQGDRVQEASVAVNLGLVLDAQGKYEESVAKHRQALTTLNEALGPENPHVGAIRNNLAKALTVLGKHAEAEAEHRIALASWEKTLGPDHPYVALSRNNLAGVLSLQGRHAEGEAEFRRALAIRERSIGADHPDVAKSRSNLAVVLSKQGKHEAAESEHRRALTVMEDALGPDHPQIGQARNNLAHALYEQRKFEEAEVEFRRALVLWEGALDPEHPLVAVSRSNLAVVLLDLGRAQEALGFAEQAWDRNEREENDTGDQALSAFVLARARWETSDARQDRVHARTLAEKALEIYGKAEGGREREQGEVKAWLDGHHVR